MVSPLMTDTCLRWDFDNNKKLWFEQHINSIEVDSSPSLLVSFPS